MTRTPAQLFGIALAGAGRGRALTAATVLLMVHALAEAAIPVLIGLTIDRAVLPADPLALALWLAVLLGTFAVLTTSYQLASRVMVSVYGYGEQALRHLTLSRILRPQLSRMRLTSGEALTFVTSDTYRVAGVAWSVAQQCATVASIAGAALAMLVISPLATIAVFAATALMMFVMRVVSSPLERRGQAEQHAATEAGAVAADFMSGFRVLVGMGARAEATNRYIAASARSKAAATTAGRSLAGYEAVSSILAALTTTGLVGASAWFASGGQISIGELITVLGLAQFISGSLAFAGSFPSNWIHKLASARRLATVINAEDLLPSRGAGADAGSDASFGPTGAASDHDVALSFSFGSDDVEVRRGELLGVRPAGSDSARELSRMLGMRTGATPGAVTLWIDGEQHRASDLDPVDYRRHVVALPHRHAISSGTLRESVRGRGAAHEPHTDAIVAAALHDTVMQMGGWDAPVGEAGRRLSGGQRQRIGLARGLHADASVLVLDEPTSAVDALTETHIAAALTRHVGTMIAITTSPVLLAACDRVIEIGRSDTGEDSCAH
ncbi:putative ABC transport system ATP-binding protein [Leucobacter luti]|uniref:Putative ABC transport system ATP-binding protein n=1 Tax=Leucobacter luti TaxID=340320 RepID=A0A4R6S3T5_9MICO|nr:ABC transporter ATP-binding protein [Leucobacter luti]TDP94312.1 putative ABC transport system ATP-binding protein [Leucobacter luti]